MGGRASRTRHATAAYGRLLRAEPQARRSLVESQLRARVGRVLRVDPDRLALRATLGKAGLDLPLALQLKTDIEAGMGVALPEADLLPALSLASLAALVLDQLAAPADPPLSFGAGPPPLKRTADQPTGAVNVPLSFAQERLWLLDQLEPGTPVYNVACALRLLGPLDAAVLQRSLDEIVRRHDVLRTTFATVDGRLVQVVAPSLAVPLSLVDLAGAPDLPVAGRAARARELAVAEARRPFDLGRGPLLRALLLRLADAEHWCVLVAHQAVCDRRSLDAFSREIALLYAAFAAGEPSPLPAPPVQYADYAQWQRQWLRGEALAARLAHWKERLGGELPVLELPADRPRPAVQSLRGATRSLDLPAEVVSGLRALGRAAGAGLDTMLLAAFQALLHRYTGLDDIIVGTPAANRQPAVTAALIGPFENPVVLRADLCGNPTFRELLDRTRAVVEDALAHQDLPFGLLAEALAPLRDLGRTPLFQAAYAFNDAPAALEAGPLKVQPIPVHNGTSEFDLTLSIVDAGAGVTATAEYDVDLFDNDTIDRLLGCFATLLAGIARDPRQPVASLPLLTAEERRRQLSAWNDTAVPYPHDKCVHQLIAERAARAPDAVAVEFHDQRLTYAELERRANQLGHYLRRLGVGPGVPVGICVERSPEMVVGFLGVLKAGGAYLPLDPTYPRERLAFMLDDARVPVLLAQENLVPALPASGARVVCLDGGWAEVAAGGAEGPDGLHGPDGRDGGVTPGDLAYIIYTSGSTGRPKGTLLAHRGLSSLVTAGAGLYGVAAASRMLQFASPCFDASVWECFTALACGATLVLAASGDLRDPAALARLLAEKRVTVALLPPPMLGQLPLDAGPALETLVVGGEACPPALAAAWAGRVRLINAYGPTEATVIATAWPVPAGFDGARPLPIGRCVPNARVYVLDRNLQPVPVGVPGELCVGGVGVALGYLNRPELTAERFVRDPWSDAAGARLYRTGDLARHLPDGNIEFLGRIDHQVKVRGFRIELGEIEAVLGQHPAVREALVVAQDAPGGKRLVAYFIPATGEAAGSTAPASGDLRAFLAARLPEYMIPSAFVTLDAFPLTPGGKVDRRALPAPEAARTGETGAFAAPRTPVEELLCAAWAEVLGLERVSAADDFFELGGHSLLATQVISRIREAMGVDLPLRVAFEARTVTALAAAVESARRAARGLQAPPILPVPRDGPLPPSFAQKRLWFYDQYEPDSPLYDLPFAIRLTGALDGDALRRALSELVRRHEALRTTFSDSGGEPAQVIHEPADLPLPVVDLGGLPEGGREAEAARLVEGEARRPFDLRTGPLLRATLVRLGDAEHLLIMNIHHIVFDGWSMAVFFRELAAIYEAYAAGGPSPLPELPIQYADFAEWQRQWLSGATLDALLGYWRRKLFALPVLELPADRARPPVQTFRGATATFCLAPDLAAGLKALGRRCGATPFMTLLAAFKALLGRYSGADDVAVGSVIANRNLGAIEGLIGFFVNTLVLRTDLAGDPPFEELVRRVRDVTLEAYAHQDLPFDRLVELLQPARDPSRSPLFQALFVLQNAPAAAAELPGLKMTWTEVDTGTAKFDLTVQMWDAPDGLSAAVEYNTDLYDAATIERMIGHFQVLLLGIVSAPHKRLSELPLLTAEERQQLLYGWNATATDYPRAACVHELFAAEAAKTPAAVAVAFQGESLTYGQLNARANQLARHLRALGVGPEVPVGLCAERSLELIIGMLGILKAGGAYVPLDPAYPRERLALMLDDACSPVLLTQQRLLGSLPAHQARVVCLDADWPAISAQDATNPESGAAPDNLAYVMYTSGSTGTPKGVSVTHRNVVRLVKATNYAAFGPDEVFLQLAPASFDAATFEVWGSLCNGARLVVMPPETPSLPALGQALREHGITTLWLTAGLFHLMVDERPDDLRGVRQLLAGGDVLSVAHVQRTLGDRRDGVLINGYGPTETTTFACTYPMGVATQVGATVPIGRPIANARVFILDKNLEPVPIGVPGELYIGGDGLARGYLNRPDLTAEAFLPSPVADRPGERLYRTGDLARYLHDGAIEFLGRIDFQVKIRGFRIEPGEIEALLGGHPAIKETVVLAREDAPGDRRLVAYYVAMPGQGAGAPGEAPSPADLRAFLRVRLPDYMVPSAFVALDAFPLTPNGKVDRRALPTPERTRAGLEAEFVAPRTPTEEVLAGLWCDVLGVEWVGVHDSFFELGGHSLLATQLVSRVRDAFRVELPLRALFAGPTVAGLAGRVEAARRDGAAPQAPPLAPVPRAGHMPPSFAQQRLWFLDQFEPGSPLYNIPMATRLSGPLDVDALKRALDEIVRRHEALRTTFVAVNGRPVQVIAPAPAVGPSAVDLPTVDLRHLPARGREAEALRLVQAEARRPFDLQAGPLLRALLLRLDPDDHVLLLNTHHVVSDGWSMGVLNRELLALYGAFAAQRPSPLPDLPVQYADFATWQRGWLSGATLEAEVAYWRGKLGGDLPVLGLPADRPRPPVQTFSGAVTSMPLSRELADALRALGRREGATPFMTLLAAFYVLLHRYSGQDDLVVGSPIANRTRGEIEGLIGFFVNTLALRADLGGNPTFRELVGRVREVALDAYAHQDVPFEQLVEALRPGRDPSRTPLFQAMFVLENAPMRPVALPGLRATPIDVHHGTAKFDLTMFVVEDGDGLALALEYNTDLFAEETAARLLGHYRRLLSGVAADPGRRVWALPLMASEEAAGLLAWQDTATAYPRDRCVHELFAAQAAQAPQAVAVIFGGERLTYGELDWRANQLANRLRRLGVGPDVLVGLLVERSLEMVIGLLGILKAGGAYVPLDPAYPRERLAFMLQDARAPVLLTQEHLLGGLPGRDAHGPRVICLDAGWGEVASESAAAPESGAGPENLAYVMYTSGSTGRPKGTCVTHRNVVRLVRETGYIEFSAAEVFLQLAPISFDAATLEVWGSLLNGARLCVMPPETPSLADLGAALARHGVTTLWLTAGLFHLMVDERLADLGGVRQLVAGGDVLSVPHVRKALAARGGGRLINGYGPTETTTFACCYPMTAKTPIGASVPIGRPIANTYTRILDRALGLLPVGVFGELHIGGDGVSRCYLNRPDLTAEMYVPDPCGAVPGARLYRTGDLARYLPDGNIEFLGRADLQVKVRGFRIELGEIEAVLGQHPAVREAVVVARDHGAGDKRLVAYVVPAGLATGAAAGAAAGLAAGPDGGDAGGDQGGDGGELREALRRFLKERLPDYMVPSAFVTLDELPLTPNGKVDRRALPAPDIGAFGVERARVAPRNATEAGLAAVWAETLGLGQIGVHDNFFELGGHSLLATQLVSRVREVFQVELPLRSLFAAPTIAGLAEHIDDLRRAGQGPAAPPAAPVARGEDARPSFAQQRLWFLDQFQPGSAVYNMPVAMRLSGPLRVDVLGRCLGEVVRRHEVLRTTFAVTDGQPTAQVVAPPPPVPLSAIDLAALPGPEREKEAMRLLDGEARRPFDLVRGPLLRAGLLRLGDADHVLLLNMHHVVGDGWSMGILFREIGALYRAFAAGEASPLPEPAIQYGDFAAWQHQWLGSPAFAAELAYWKGQLAGKLPALELPADRPRPAVQSLSGATRERVLPPRLAAGVNALSRAEGVTPFMTLLAAFQTLLHRYTGQEDIIVGSPIANRNRREVEGLIGFFVNTLALRTDLGGDPSFRELLRRVREVTLSAYAHQDLPFEKLVEALQPDRDASRTPVFQVVLNVLNAPLETLDLPGVTAADLGLHTGTSKFDLSLFACERPDGLLLAAEYSTDLHDAATIDRLLEHMETLLQGIVADPDRRLSQFRLLTGAEWHRLVVEWNDTTRDYPCQTCIHELFAARAQEHPGAIALSFQGRPMTYRELHHRSDQLAHYLRRLGVGHETLVGICVERSPEMVVGMLGVLKAGGAYVPLDPAYPGERLAFVLDDVKAPVLLTQERLLPGLPACRARVVCLDAGWDEIAAAEAAGAAGATGAPGSGGAGGPRGGKATARSLAYVIHTSGSTGRPKGTMLTHRGVVSMVSTATALYGVTPQSRMLQFASPCFDASVWECFMALAVGATLVLAPAEELRDPRGLCAVLADEAVTVALLPPSMLSQLPLDAGPALETLVVGGEACPPALAAAWAKRVRLINAYGPTEATVIATTWPVPREVDDSRPLPIGRPVPNAQAFILDKNLQPVPVGVAGELYVGGDGLARGYLSRRSLTRERFIKNPFNPRRGARLYKTGDLARYLPDGAIEFLGRADEQVKIRGFRVEPGEIEATLAAHPAVRAAAVVAREDRPGDKRLVAYVVPAAGPAAGRSPAVEELRAFLRQKLPDYMVPAAFVTLDALPLTPSGKVDRRALPAPDQGRPGLAGAFVAPRTPLEADLAGIFAQVLGLERVGIYDSFFELGGHSLLATRLVSRVREALRVELPLRSLFEAPAVADLGPRIAALAAGRQGAAPDAGPAAIQRIARRGAAPGAGIAGAGAADITRHLTDQEVDSLLGEALAGEEGGG